LFFEKQVKKSNQQKLLFVSVLLSLLFGIVIEILQTKITLTRSGDIYDIMANFVGSILAFVFISVGKRSKYTQNLSDIKSRF
jgi:glycopeptide antibiotics resistance protein